MAQPVPTISEANGWTFVFDEEFNSNWYSEIGTQGWINPTARQKWLPRMADGKNAITGFFGTSQWDFLNMNAQGQSSDPHWGYLNAWYYAGGNSWNGSLISSMDWSRNGFAAVAPFYVEAEVWVAPLLANDAPNTPGLWAAPVWLLGANSVPGANYGSNVAEIDHELYSSGYYQDLCSAHDWSQSTGQDDLHYQNGYDPTGGLKTFDFSKGFHVYGILVGLSTITWYVDGQVAGQCPTPASALGPMMIISDLSLGGGWPVNLNKANTGVGHGVYEQQLNYIRCWQQ